MRIFIVRGSPPVSPKIGRVRGVHPIFDRFHTSDTQNPRVPNVWAVVAGQREVTCQLSRNSGKRQVLDYHPTLVKQWINNRLYSIKGWANDGQSNCQLRQNSVFLALDKSPKKCENHPMTKELDKKRLLAILEKKVSKFTDRNKSQQIHLFIQEDLNEVVITERPNGGNNHEYIYHVSNSSHEYVGVLLTEIEAETHRRFELKNPFVVKAHRDNGLALSDAYEIIFNPRVKQKTTEDIANELHFELHGNQLKLIGFPFAPVIFKSDIKLSIIKQLAEAKATGPIGTAELTDRTNSESAKTISNSIKEINDKVCETFKLEPDEFIPKSSPKSGYKLGDRIFILVK
jgi:hypothetical protein